MTLNRNVFSVLTAMTMLLLVSGAAQAGKFHRHSIGISIDGPRWCDLHHNHHARNCIPPVMKVPLQQGVIVRDHRGPPGLTKTCKDGYQLLNGVSTVHCKNQ